MCFHCNDSNLCNCISCTIEDRNGTTIAGPCVACKGRAELDRLWQWLDDLGIDCDPRELEWWERVSNPRDALPSHRVLRPLVLMRELMKP